MSTPSNPSPTPETKRQRWRRRIRRYAIVLVVLVIVVRLLLEIMLPTAINRAAGFYGMDCEYGRAKLGFTGGYAAIWDIKLTSRQTGQTIATSEFAEMSLSVWDLLLGRLRIWRLGADGADVQVTRAADGSIPLLTQFVGAQAQTPPAANEPPRELDLTPPLQVEAVRLSRLQVHLRDESVTPVFEKTVALNIRVSSVGHLEEPTKIDIQGWSDGLLEDLRIVGQAKSVGRTVDAQLNVRARGARAAGMAGYLGMFGISGEDEPIDGYATVKLSTTPVAGTLDALKGRIEISDVRLLHGRDEAAHAGRVVIEASHFSPAKVAIKELLVDDVDVRANRNQRGQFGFAGLDYAGATPATRPTTQPAPAPAVTAGMPLPEMSLDRLAVRNIKLRFADQAVSAGSELGLDVKEFTLTNLRSRPTTQPTEGQIVLKGELSAPGLATLIRVEGKADPFAKTSVSNLNVHVEGITLAAARPYLLALGIEPELRNASFDFGVDAQFERSGERELVGAIKLANLRLSDSGDLLRVDSARIDGCRIDPTTFAVAIDSIDVQGPRLSAYRNGQGQFGMLGMKKVAPTTQPRSPQAPTTQPSAEPASSMAVTVPIPSLKIGRFTWKGISLDFRDDFIKPAASMSMTDAGVEVKSLDIQFRPTTRPAEKAQWRKWVRFPGVVDAVDVTGTLAITPSSIEVTADAKASGITAAKLAPYASLIGVTPLVKGATAQGSFAANAMVDGNTVKASLNISKVDFKDQGQSLASLGKFEISDLVTDGTRSSIKRIQVDAPRLVASRNVDESFELLGMRVVPMEGDDGPPPVARLPELPLVKLGEFRVSDAQFSWSDRTFAPAAATELITSAGVTGLTMGEKADPAKITARTSVKGAVEKILSEGTIQLAPGAFSFTGNAKAEGITPSTLDAYLPGSVGFRNGVMQLLASGSVTNNPAGGIAARLDVTDMQVGESGQEPVLLVPAAKVHVSRIDPAGLQIGADELSLNGLKLKTARTADGAIFVGGLRLGGTDNRPKLVASTTRPASAPKEKDVSAMVAAARKALPEISVNRMLFAADEIRFTDEMRPAAKPISLRNVSLRNTDRLVWLGKDAYSQPANRLEATLQLDPLASNVKATIETAPFAAQPSAQLKLNVTGISGAKLTEIAPELAELVDGSTLKDGSLELLADLSARVERRGPVEFDFVRGFNVDLAVRKIAFRNGDSPRILGGLDELRVTNARIDLAASKVTIPTVEINRPIAYVTRDAAGIHAMGLTLKPATSSGSASASPAAQAQPAGQAAPAGEPFELAIRKLTFSGLDVVYEDKAFTPTVVVPLKDLDAEIQNITTAKTTKPMRISALLYSGKTQMRQRGTSAAEAGMEERELFALVTVNGQLAAYPRPNGWVKTSLNALDLTAFHGAAKAAGIGLYDGILDAQADIRILNENDADVRARAVLTDLSVSEGENGAISRYLRLPATLDAVIALLQDADGSITVPADVQMRGRSITPGSMIAAATSATIKTIGTAVAAAPLKAAQGVGGLMGLGGDKEPEQQVESVIQFLPGDIDLHDVSMQPFNEVIDAMRDNRRSRVILRHALSPSDLSIAQRRANPNVADALELIQSARDRKALLIQERAQLASSLRTALAAVPETALHRQTERMSRLDTDLANVETSLDEFAELLRPGADRQADRRTRAASIEIGEARIKAVRQYLESLDLKDIDSRIETAPVSAKVVEGNVNGAVTLVVVQEK